jgi:hypothetical protein
MTDDRYTSDQVTDDIGDDSGSSLFSYTGALPLGLPSRRGAETRPDEYGDQPYDDPSGEGTYDETGTRETRGEELGEGSWWDEGLISLLLVVGIVLFLIPEPATSGLGILLVGAGVVLWLVDWLA